MPYGYTGQNLINQTVKNSGVFSISDVADLTKQGKFGGSLELIEEQNLTSGASTIEFTNLKELKYDVHYLKGTVFFDGTANSNYDAYIRVSNDGGSTYESGANYQYAYLNAKGESTSFNERRDTAATYFRFEGAADRAASSLNFYSYFYNLGDSGKYSFMTFQSSAVIYLSGAEQLRTRFGGQVYDVAETINALQFSTNATQYDTDTNIKLYGVKQI
jgi:hypothetical protein